MKKTDFTGFNFMQGDTEWFQIKKLPDGIKKIDKQFIATSEKKGSFHALFGNYDMYEDKDCFVMDVKEECILNHSLKSALENNCMDNAKILPKKDHRHTIVPKGIYIVGIQQRFDPLAGMKKKVID